MKQFSTALLLAVLGWAAPAWGQGGTPVGWLRASLDAPLRGKWSLHTEVETRQSNTHLHGQQLGRLGLRVRIAPCLSFAAGYVFAANEGPMNNGPALPEHRLYQEIALADVTGPLRVSHRIRTEERWLRTSQEAPYRFAPRLRYQLRLVAPLGTGGRLPVGGLYAVFANEVFAGLGPREGRNFLEENRMSAGLGYRLSRRTTLEVAYLRQNQADELRVGQAYVRNALQVSLAVAAPSRPALVRI